MLGSGVEPTSQYHDVVNDDGVLGKNWTSPGQECEIKRILRQQHVTADGQWKEVQISLGVYMGAQQDFTVS